MHSDTKSVCKGCPTAYQAINGLFCPRLHRYVEYETKQQPCINIINPSK